MAFGAQFVEIGGIHVTPLHLAIGGVVAATIRPFVPVETEPGKIFHQCIEIVIAAALGIGILATQHEPAAVAARQ